MLKALDCLQTLNFGPASLKFEPLDSKHASSPEYDVNCTCLSNLSMKFCIIAKHNSFTSVLVMKICVLFHRKEVDIPT